MKRSTFLWMGGLAGLARPLAGAMPPEAIPPNYRVGHPVSHYFTADNTFLIMFGHRAGNWTRTPRLTYTRPGCGHVGPNYISGGERHQISLENLPGYCKKFPAQPDKLSMQIGYRFRRSRIRNFTKEGNPDIVQGMEKDGISAVSGALVSPGHDPKGHLKQSGSPDTGYSHAGKVAQALFMWPKGSACNSLAISLQKEIKEVRRHVSRAGSRQFSTNGALRLRHNLTN